MTNVMFVLALSATQAAAPAGSIPGQGTHTTPTVVRKDYDMTKLAAPPALPEEALAGRRLFAQRCGLCHDPVGQSRVSGPWLDRETVSAPREASARRIIAQGSARMPGFQHALQPAQIEQIVTFLKHVAPEQNPRAPR